MNAIARALQPAVDLAWKLGARPSPVASTRPSVPSVAAPVASSPENPASSLSNPEAWLLEALGAAAATDAGVTVNERTANLVPAFYRAIGIISGTLGTCDLEVGRIVAGGEGEHFVREPEHPVQAILNEPNDVYSQFMFVEGLAERVLVRGNSYVAIAWKNSMRPERLTPLQPEHVQDVRRVRGRLKYLVEYEDQAGFNARKIREVVDQDYMLHVAGPGFNGLVSPSPIRYAAREALGLALSTQSYQARYLTAGARPSGVLALEKGIDDATFEKVKAQWKSTYTGLSKAGQTAVLPSGATYLPISFTHADAEIIATRKFSIADIGRIYGIPLHLLGESEKSTSWGTGLAEQSASFVRFVLKTWMRRIETELTRKLFWSDERPAYRVRFNRDELIRGVGAAHAAFIETLVQKAAVITPNEGRRELGYGPLPDGDTLRSPTGAPVQSPGQSPGQSNEPADAGGSQESEDDDDA